MSAQDVLRQLRALGAHIDCQDGRLELRAGRRSVPERLVEQARAVKSELILLLDNPELQKQRPSPTRGEGGTLREETPSKAPESLVFAEECQVASFGGILRRESGILRDPVASFGGKVASFDAKTAKSATEECQVASFVEPQHSCGFQAPNAPKDATLSECWGESSFSTTKMGQFASQPEVIESPSFMPADIPAGWVGGLSRLRPDCPPGDIPMQRWQQFIADARRLLRNGTLAQAAALGWDEIDLFGCDDTRPFARIDQMGLAWLITGWRVVSISASAAIIEAPTGSRQTYRRKEHGVGQIPAWELCNQGDLN